MEPDKERNRCPDCLRVQPQRCMLDLRCSNCGRMYDLADLKTLAEIEAGAEEEER